MRLWGLEFAGLGFKRRHGRDLRKGVESRQGNLHGNWKFFAAHSD